MSSEYSISISDWSELDADGGAKWNFIGRDVAIEKFGDAEDGAKGDNAVQADGFYPMMNYAYPIYRRPSDEEILAVQDQTCLTVVENNETGDFFLALCGGNMDLSQDIALAYVLIGERVPPALAFSVSRQYGLSKSGENFFKMAEACRKSLETEAIQAKSYCEEWAKAIIKGKKKERSDKRRWAKRDKDNKKGKK